MTEIDEPQGELTLRTLAMPADTNPAGDIFGGWVLAQMDAAAGIRSSERAKGRTVTAAVKEVSFKRPVKVGDTVCIYTSISHVGRTSMTLYVECWVRRQFTQERQKVTDAHFIMVALDEKGSPRQVEPEAV
ncbi:acyl-CoA thioesterase [Agrobacterium vitis]|uniref:acyl-CoA thioesterase n=1 Tax=Rhizobium/Agrobacterium group TaxID=227290 RepID=UPI0012E7556C|nr:MULTISPECIES: acyl-CoA thioesterase [Rhizobium/Agrobacterium group]MCF1472503.1 acyl-CoA thioesterase [Allorhizobium ampelinum]MVA49703.1 acyl-CoA thioesterase [Agrobacterium vitis]NSZ54313.1 acyl-CoA thioesterase [Agrobacterium vitis]NTA34410.1 acyl-CoA thioesterase [Agrobacterium vitis]BCH67140.1 acyl-CoA thioesterase [Agrobacterium vitis]